MNYKKSIKWFSIGIGLFCTLLILTAEKTGINPMNGWGPKRFFVLILGCLMITFLIIYFNRVAFIKLLIKIPTFINFLPIEEQFKALLRFLSQNWARISAYVLGLIFALFCLFYEAAYFLQEGHINLKEKMWFDDVYFDMWNHLIHFDVTANPSVVGPEAYIVNGKTLAYFLPLPALVRGILSVFNLGTYSVISMLIAFIFFVVFSALLFSLMIKIVLPGAGLNPAIKVGWIIFLTFGSPILLILANSSTYWEAIAWAAAMYMVCLYSSMSILSKPKSMFRLVIFAVVCGLTLFTRVTYTIGVCVIFSLTILNLFINLIKSGKGDYSLKDHVYHKYELIGVLIIFSIFGASLGILNTARWGNPFEFQLLANNVQLIGNERGKGIQTYGSLNIDRIPENTSYYFFPSKDNFGPDSPFIQAGTFNYFKGFAKYIDYREPTNSIPIVLPVYSLLTILGIGFFMRTIGIFFNKNSNLIYLFPLMPAFIGAFIPGIFLLPLSAQALRYRVDFTPGIVLFSIYAIVVFFKSSYAQNIKQVENKPMTILKLLGIFALLFISIYLISADSIIEHRINYSQWPEQGPYEIADRFPLLFSRFTYKLQLADLTDGGWDKGVLKTGNVVIFNNNDLIVNHLDGATALKANGIISRIISIDYGSEHIRVTIDGNKENLVYPNIIEAIK